MITPTVHLNGTSREALDDQFVTAINALTAAMNAVAAAGPNARDYYVQGPDAFRIAQQGHQARLDQLKAVRAQIEQLLLSVADPEELI